VLGVPFLRRLDGRSCRNFSRESARTKEKHQAFFLDRGFPSIGFGEEEM
jgi:hypothetical protein